MENCEARNELDCRGTRGGSSSITTPQVHAENAAGYRSKSQDSLVVASDAAMLHNRGHGGSYLGGEVRSSRERRGVPKVKKALAACTCTRKGRVSQARDLAFAYAATHDDEKVRVVKFQKALDQLLGQKILARSTAAIPTDAMEIQAKAAEA
jgi:hypothetical protein